MKKSRIYVVVGETGEYDGFTSWNVCAFKSDKKAQELKKLCNRWLIDNKIHFSGNKNRPKIYDDKKENRKEIKRIMDICCNIMDKKIINPFDKNLDYMDYSGAEYKIIEVDFEE